ncbi:unnamed protein product [Didymodactylos carnosus]|uniref:Knr4/Smi1-like domain-containing protein n=1 Tax=Didymodactylos carnosus TaxID=1234261 RepID=A0A815S231_9BILA|nr:unnamed protein product [Didymodactylos carnosus]CAF1484415.1 unnamed protein product [Didymodactylos carnosus]CAF3844859.1 unnamed protein product [Didymodactylos carnosus]CAF4348760.1 unnamed protein product [Didymodactylos carnosus]
MVYKAFLQPGCILRKILTVHTNTFNMATSEINDSITSRTRSKSTTSAKLWNQLNDVLEYVPKFQNKDRSGVDEKTIQRIESKLGIILPNEIQDVIKIHDGRDHIFCGLNHRLATTDLLPIEKWRPYENESPGYADLLFECLAQKKDVLVDKNLRNDVQDHLAAYIDGITNAEQQSKNKKKKISYQLDKDEAFHALPCELLIIGEGMDDYGEQYLLSIRSGRIYLGLQTIPNWILIGTFADWIKMGIEAAKQEKEDIQNSHDEIEI